MIKSRKQATALARKQVWARAKAGELRIDSACDKVYVRCESANAYVFHASYRALVSELAHELWESR